MMMIGLLIVAGLALTGIFAAKQALLDRPEEGLAGEKGIREAMPVPGPDGVEESAVDQGMPVPGIDGVEESVVSQGMPVPGIDGVVEMIVGDGAPAEQAISGGMAVPGLAEGRCEIDTTTCSLAQHRIQ
jgi:hypothetical protein